MTTARMEVNLTVEIKKFCQNNRINLSKWIRKEFTRQYLGNEQRTKELEELSQRQEQLLVEIKAEKEANNALKQALLAKWQNLNQIEKNYLLAVPGKAKEGKELTAMHRYFCSEYQSIGLDTFEALVEIGKEA